MTSDTAVPITDDVRRHVMLLESSYRRWTGRNLTPSTRTDADDGSAVSPFEAIIKAPFVLVSHDARPDPVFNFGNRAALALFEMSWKQFTNLESRESAEPDGRSERDRLMARVAREGVIEGYEGVRVSATGRRFRITGATIWQVVDEDGRNHGRAAKFAGWVYL